MNHVIINADNTLFGVACSYVVDKIRTLSRETTKVGRLSVIMRYAGCYYKRGYLQSHF